MAEVPGTIRIFYTPAITSSASESSPFICHRICYRQGSSGAYCCLTDNTDSIAGTPKAFDITIGAAPCGSVPAVDPESCVNTSYEGYIQACCEAIDALDGRVFWTAEFILDPSCVNKLTCCQGARDLQDSYYTITNAGTGYDPAMSPLIVSVVRQPGDSILPGGTNDAIIHATIGGGGTITNLTTIQGGLYSKIPLLVIPSSPGGVTATAIALVPCTDNAWSGNCENGLVNPVNLLLGTCANYCYPRAFPYNYNNDILAGDPDLTHFNYTPVGCCGCATCRSYSVVTGSALANIILCYTVCSNPDAGSPGPGFAHQICIEVSGSGSHTIDCAVPGSIYCISDPTAILAINDIGICSDCIG